MRALKWTGYVAALLGAVLLAAMVLLLATPAGLGVIVNVASRLAPALSIHGWSGSLIRGVCLDTLEYRAEGASVEITNVCVHADLWESVDHLKLRVYDASADTVDIQTEPGPEPATSYAPPLPFAIEVVDQATLGTLRVNALELTSLRASGRLDGDELDASGRLAFGDLVLDAVARGEWRALDIKGTLEVPEPVAVDVLLDLTQTRLPYKLSATAATLDLQRWAGRPTQVAETRLTLDGDLETYRFDLSADVSDAAIGQAALTARGSGDFDGVTLTSTVNLTPDVALVQEIGTLGAEGRIGWRGGLDLDLRVQASRVTAALAGHVLTVGGNLTVVGTPTNLAVRAGPLDGTLDERPVAGTTALRWLDGRLLVDELELDLGEGHLSATGDFRDGTMSLSARARTLPLAVADARIGGTVSGTLSLSGFPDAPRLQADLHAADPTYGGFALESVDLNYGGSLDNGTLDLRAARGDGRLSTLMSLVRGHDVITANLASLSAEYDVLPTDERVRLTLLDSADLRIAGGGFVLEPACLETRQLNKDVEPARICVAGNYPDGGASVTIEDLQLPDLALPAGSLHVRALVNAEMDVDSFQPLAGRGRVAISDLVASMDDYVRPVGRLNLDAELSETEARLGISSPPDQALVAEGNLMAKLAPEILDSSLDGHVSVTVDGIRLVEEFLPMEVAYEIGDLSGQLSATADVAGRIAAPSISGTVRAQDAGWRVEATRTSFSAVQMSATLTDSSSLTLAVDGKVGDGSVALSGNVEHLNTPESVLTSTMNLDEAEVLNLPDYAATLSGEAHLVMTPDALKIDADVTMPRARIEIAELPESAVSVSPDTVLVGAEAQPPPQQLRTTRVQLRLGDSVRFKAFGLSTRLTGQLTLTETPGRPPDLRGVLTLKGGTFEAYGQELKVTRGELTFIGPLNDPLLNVVASRTVERSDGNVEVSLVLRGSAQNIETEVRSSPALPEGDALALLLTGRTLTEMTSGEQNSVYGAAIALGLYGASGVTRSLASNMGLEEIILDEDQGEWEVGAAVRLRRNVYLRYTYSVFSRIGGVLLRYQLTDRVSVQGKTGDSQSIEIRYGVD